MKRKIFLILIISIFSLTVCGQKDWQKQIEKIRPLKTTEAEVEKILGKPEERYGDWRDYKTNGGIITVVYSEGRCKSQRTPKYNIDEGVVVRVDFKPRKKIKFASLEIDVTGLEKKITEPNDVEVTIITYYDAAKGTYYSVIRDLLNSVKVYPLDEMDYLQCPKSSD